MNALRNTDRVLALIGWLAAALVVVMLLAGPAVVASDKGMKSSTSAPYSASGGVNGAQLFKANCGSCHTLSAAGTSGAVGPNLDNTALSATAIEAKIRSGGGVMPSFDGKLSGTEIKAVAAYVASSH